MKQGWERTNPFHHLELKRINDLTAQVFGGQRITRAEPLGGGLRNSNYRIVVENCVRPYVLRLYVNDPSLCRKEAELAQFVRDRVPVPRFIHADWSQTRPDFAWAVMEWADGTPLSAISASGNRARIESAAQSVGSVLARIHEFRFPEPGFFGDNLQVSKAVAMDASFFLEFIGQHLEIPCCMTILGAELSEAVGRMCKRHAALLDSRAHMASLVHSDFNGLNVLLHERNGCCETSAVLDWEFAFAADPLVDIGNMIRYEQPDSPFEWRFVDAYRRAGGELPENWRLLAKLADLIALIDMLSRSQNTPVRANDLRRLIAGTVREYG